MKLIKFSPLCALFALFLTSGIAFAKADAVDLYIDAVMTGDVAELQKLLAPNFWYIGANGHIRDKDHFLEEIRDKKLIVNRITLSNVRETQLGETRLVTGNGVFYGASEAPRPQGAMRYTLVIANNKGQEEVVLFQATPVIPTVECRDGNCKIK